MTKRTIKPIHPMLCRVCGLEQKIYPWGPSGTKPSFEICACCGVEFGHDDATETGVRRAREKWMKAGYPWAEASRKPHGWIPDHQLARLEGTQWDPWA